MKKTLFTIAMMALTGSAWAQNQIPCEMEITYSTTYRLKKDVKTPPEDRQILQVGPNGLSHFSSEWAVRSAFVMDSLMKTGLDPMTIIAERKRLGVTNGQEYHVYKNLPKENMLTYTDKLMEEMFYEEEMPTFNWEMEEGDTTIVGFDCQKAVTDFRGRRWTAWFTTDIPVSDGPWKLCGLPGLILSAFEDDGFFSFSCIGISKGNGKSFDIPKTKKMTKANIGKIHELKDKSVNDIRGMLQSTLGLDPGEILDQNGEVFRQEQSEVVFIEYVK